MFVKKQVHRNMYLSIGTETYLALRRQRGMLPVPSDVVQVLCHGPSGEATCHSSARCSRLDVCRQRVPPNETNLRMHTLTRDRKWAVKLSAWLIDARRSASPPEPVAGLLTASEEYGMTRRGIDLVAP
jgi:hypothetical protein